MLGQPQPPIFTAMLQLLKRHQGALGESMDFALVQTTQHRVWDHLSQWEWVSVMEGSGKRRKRRSDHRRHGRKWQSSTVNIKAREEESMLFQCPRTAGTGEIIRGQRLVRVIPTAWGMRTRSLSAWLIFPDVTPYTLLTTEVFRLTEYNSSFSSHRRSYFCRISALLWGTYKL